MIAENLQIEFAGEFVYNPCIFSNAGGTEVALTAVHFIGGTDDGGSIYSVEWNEFTATLPWILSV